MKALLLVIISTLYITNLFAQDKHLKQADNFYAAFKYKEALAEYLKAYETKDVKNEFHITEQIAETYRHVSDYEESGKWYAKLAEYTDRITDVELLEYAQVLEELEKYGKAKEIYALAVKKGNKTDFYADYYNGLCDWAMMHQNKSEPFSTYLTNIEVGGRHMGMAYYQKGLLVSLPVSKEFENKTVYYDFTYAQAKDSINFEQPQKLKGTINGPFYEAGPSFTNGGKTLYFTMNSTRNKRYVDTQRSKAHLNKNGEASLEIFTAQLKDTVWTDVKPLDFESYEFDYSFPFICEDGKTLFFCSDMPGGHGGYDIYKSTFIKDSVWSKPENLGNDVNTSDDELYPFILGDKFYFASRGHVGFGGVDMFVASYKNEMVKNVKNMGKPFNSSKDDFNFIAINNGDEGYFASNREGNHGYDKIYYFKHKPLPEVYDTLRGTARDRITGKPMNGAKVELFEILADGSKKLVSTVFTGEDGKFEFIINPKKKYEVVIDYDNYEKETVKIPIKKDDPLGLKDALARLKNLVLKPIIKKNNVVRIDNIYFDFGKATLKSESLPILDNLISFMKENTAMRIELSAHTDAKGSDAYNMKLSELRAKSCADYLKAKGIDMSRVVPKGYGETRLINNCPDPAKCTEEENKVNRRVEVKIL